jgi:hypothetical protein
MPKIQPSVTYGCNIDFEICSIWKIISFRTLIYQNCNIFLPLPMFIIPRHERLYNRKTQSRKDGNYDKVKSAFVQSKFQ